jgi:hypothetical protein
LNEANKLHGFKKGSLVSGPFLLKQQQTQTGTKIDFRKFLILGQG